MRTLILERIEQVHDQLHGLDATRTVRLDLPDIQGFVLHPVGFVAARFSFFHVADVEAGRRFVAAVAALVSDARVPEFRDGKPVPQPSEVSVAFTLPGLAALGVPARTLDSFPPEFREGMRARAREFLVDRGPSDPDGWEAPWRDDRVHAWVSVQANDAGELARLHALVTGAARAEGIELLDVQEAGALETAPGGGPTSKEHFGYTDGIGDPEIEGSGWPSVRGRGKWDEKRNDWVPLAPGEFVLGYPDEAGELPKAPVPVGLARNGTFMVYRKLHQNVAAFRRFLQREGAAFPGGAEFLAAKLVGRWRNGAPLLAAPEPRADGALPDVDGARLTDFRYGDDREGGRCPMGAHIRRANPRDSLGFHGVLVDQRRIVRRGLPYGEWIPEDTPLDDVARLDQYDDETDAATASGAPRRSRHGVIFMALNASLERQFEFVQREWMNYGNDFRQGNDRDPIADARAVDDRMVIQGRVLGDDVRPPHVCRGLEQFAVTRGGAYFFVPGITALHLIAAGRVERA